MVTRDCLFAGPMANETLCDLVDTCPSRSPRDWSWRSLCKITIGFLLKSCQKRPFRQGLTCNAMSVSRMTHLHCMYDHERAPTSGAWCCCSQSRSTAHPQNLCGILVVKLRPYCCLLRRCLQSCHISAAIRHGHVHAGKCLI